MDPDPGFMGQKSTGSRIRNRNKLTVIFDKFFTFWGFLNFVFDPDLDSTKCIVLFFHLLYLPFRDLKIEIYCWSPSGNHKPMGSCHTTLRRHTPHKPHTFFLPFVPQYKNVSIAFAPCVWPHLNAIDGAEETYRNLWKKFSSRKASDLNIWPVFSVFRDHLQLYYVFIKIHTPQITIKSRM